MPPSGQFLKLLQSVRRSEEDAILIELQGRYTLCYLQWDQILTDFGLLCLTRMSN
jgi:hypothetical protein